MVALGSDHGGYDLKQAVIGYLKERGIEYKDYGCPDKSSCDYPEFGRAAAMAVANKVKGIRCALCSDTLSAKMTRLHNDANMLALGAGIVGTNLALDIVETFLNTDFSGEERHSRRINKIEG